jgi:hypothetical protein
MALVTVAAVQKLLGFVAQVKYIVQHPWVIVLLSLNNQSCD